MSPIPILFSIQFLNFLYASSAAFIKLYSTQRGVDLRYLKICINGHISSRIKLTKLSFIRSMPKSAGSQCSGECWMKIHTDLAHYCLNAPSILNSRETVAIGNPQDINQMCRMFP